MALKTVSIDSLKQEDITAMFNLICERIALKKPYEVIADVKAKFKGEAFFNKEPTSVDLLKTIFTYDIDFELKLTYVVPDTKEEEIIPKKNEGMTPEITSTIMQEQKSEIKNPGLVEEKKNDSIHKVDEEKLPDFD